MNHITFDFDRLQRLRKHKGYTTKYMGEQLGISHVSYSKKEKGQMSMTVRDLCDIVEALNLSPLVLSELFVRH